MGLNISAYSNCKPVDVELDEEGESTIENTVETHVNFDYPERADGMPSRQWYQYDRSMSFTAGSYPNYGHWRRQLASLGGYDAEDAWNGLVPSGPFLELVDFADNEGVIGPITSAKLANDFATYETAARKVMEGRDMVLYKKWRQAFEMARQGGLIKFD